MSMTDESRRNGSDDYFPNAYCRFVCLNFGMLSIVLGILLGIFWAVERWRHPMSFNETTYFKVTAAGLGLEFGLCVIFGGLCHLWLVRHPRLYNWPEDGPTGPRMPGTTIAAAQDPFQSFQDKPHDQAS